MLLYDLIINLEDFTMKKTMILVLVVNMFMLAGCGGSGGGGKASGSGEKYSTGTFSVQVPKGWAVSPFYRSGQVVPNTLGVHKGTQDEYKMMSVPCMQIQFSTASGFNGERNAKAAYQELKDMQPVTLGKNTWKGYTGMATRTGVRYDLPVIYMWTEIDGANIVVAIWTELGDKKISLNDADVKALIGSITPE